MKTNFLLLLFITLTISEVTLAETLNKGTKIELKYHLRKDHRSVIKQPFQVFLNASFITIEQDVSSSAVSFYTITIKDANTGKVTETLTTTGTIYIDISNFLSAEYDIEIDMESMLLYGSFTIQNN